MVTSETMNLPFTYLNNNNNINNSNNNNVNNNNNGAGIINWNKGELDRIDHQTLKLFNTHRDLYPCSSVGRLYRLYIPRDQESRGLLNAKTVLKQKNLICDYAANNSERFLEAPNEELQLRTKADGKNKEQRENERQAAWKVKALHGQCLRETEGMQGQMR